MAVAWYRFMIPTLTNPTISTVVTPELWISAVEAIPIPTLTIRLSAVLPNKSLIFPVASCSILEVSRCTPTKNTPVPASSLTKNITIPANVISFPHFIFHHNSCYPFIPLKMLPWYVWKVFLTTRPLLQKLPRFTNCPYVNKRCHTSQDSLLQKIRLCCTFDSKVSLFHHKAGFLKSY